jgi:transcriptional regulator with XRE-family HTH domain
MPDKWERSPPGYKDSMHRSIRIDDPLLAPALGGVIREARSLAGWTQAELAERARTSQSMVARLELGRRLEPDVVVVSRVLAALGLRGSLEIQDRALDDRRRQRDPVHARLAGYAMRRLERLGWTVRTEVPFGRPAPRGWLDLVAIRDADALISEIKGDIPDVGGMQRQVAVYSAVAGAVFESLGWRPRQVGTLVLGLDSRAVAGRLADNRILLAPSFPGHPIAMATWLEHGGAPPMPTIAMADPLSRSRDWLRRTPLSGRRSAPAYADYADAAEWLRRRPRGARPRGPPRGW